MGGGGSADFAILVCDFHLPLLVGGLCGVLDICCCSSVLCLCSMGSSSMFCWCSMGLGCIILLFVKV